MTDKDFLQVAQAHFVSKKQGSTKAYEKGFQDGWDAMQQFVIDYWVDFGEFIEGDTDLPDRK